MKPSHENLILDLDDTPLVEEPPQPLNFPTWPPRQAGDDDGREMIVENEGGGQFTFSPDKVAVRRSETEGGEELRLQMKEVGFNATFIDCLYDHQDHPAVVAFSAQFKEGDCLFAWETVFTAGTARLRWVRYLMRENGRWKRTSRCIDAAIFGNALSLVRI